MAAADAAIRAFCAQQREWLDLELKSEQQQQQQQQQQQVVGKIVGNTTSRSSREDGEASTSSGSGQRSNVLHSLEASEVSVGLYGRTVVRLVPTTTTTANQPLSSSSLQSSSLQQQTQKQQLLLLPAHRFTTGDEVEIRSSKAAKKNHHSNNNSHSYYPSGVISEVTESSLSVALFPAKQQRKGKNDGANVVGDTAGDDDDDLFANNHHAPFTLIPKSNVEVHRKLLAALTELEVKGVDHAVSGRIVQALFNPTPTTTTATATTTTTTTEQQQQQQQQLQELRPFNANLDSSQLEAISFALASKQPIALIHGPPGTGKTTTVVELIQQAVHVHGYKVLVTAPSNVAVDNVLARLVVAAAAAAAATTTTTKRSTTTKQSNTAHGTRRQQQPQQPLRVVRLGHPARLQEAILPYSLEALVQAADGTDIVRDVRAELQSHLRTLSTPHDGPKAGSGGGKNNNNNNNRVNRRLAYTEMKALRQELRKREEKVVADLLAGAHVVLATCVGAGHPKLLLNRNSNNTKVFDLVVIDEAAQALEAACWIPALQAGTKLVLAGDHLQLPPTIMSNIPAVQEGLGKTMFERVVELYGDHSGKAGSCRVSRMLKVQYRMHESIANWASQALYGGELQTHDSVKARTLAQLEGIVTTGEGAGEGGLDEAYSGLGETPLLLVDTAGCNMYETENAAGSRFNEGEAQLVVQHVRKLIEMGVQQEQIAVITPYNGQVEILRLALLPEAPKLQIRSVDGFQGGEREAVVLSLVRSSDRGGMKGIGFLRDDRRLNVAVTRAKRHCCVICDTDTVSQSPFVKNLIDWIEEHGEHRSAIEMLSDAAADGGQMDAELVLAELELQRLSEKATTQYSSAAKKSNWKALDTVDTERRRLTLLEQIRAFQSNAKPGDEMLMSTELSKLDRKLVHEIAEGLGLGHQSDGVENVNRRIKLMVPNLAAISKAAASLTAAAGTQARDSSSQPAAVVANVEATPTDITDAARVEAEVGDDVEPIREDPLLTAQSSFAAFQVGIDDEDDDDDDSPPMVGQETVEQPALNSVLAKERAERERQKLQHSSAQKAKKKKGQKLGGSKKCAPLPPKDDGLADLDELAFLDAQIDQVQKSHGRQVEGAGQGYRTIINGVLLAKPKPPEKKKDAKATAALNAKLREAQDGRKTKSKK